MTATLPDYEREALEARLMEQVNQYLGALEVEQQHRDHATRVGLRELEEGKYYPVKDWEKHFGDFADRMKAKHPHLHEV